MASFIARSALSAAVLLAAACQAHAITTVDIAGGALASYPGNGTSVPQNNVMNSGSSGLTDAANGGNLKGSVIGTPASVSVSGTEGGFWGVNWWFAGAESGDTIQLVANSTVGAPTTIIYNEANQNNNAGGSPQIGPQWLGTTYQKGDGLIDFSLKDLNTGQIINNLVPAGNAIPNTKGFSSLVFSFLTAPEVEPSATDTLATTLTQTMWFMFAFNDNGSGDDNHDDFVGFAEVFFTNGGEIPGVPLPPALVLFGSALLGLTLLARRRRLSHGRA